MDGRWQEVALGVFTYRYEGARAAALVESFVVRQVWVGTCSTTLRRRDRAARGAHHPRRPYAYEMRPALAICIVHGVQGPSGDEMEGQMIGHSLSPSLRVPFALQHVAVDHVPL